MTNDLPFGRSRLKLPSTNPLASRYSILQLFVIRASSFFRHSDFVIRHFLLVSCSDRDRWDAKYAAKPVPERLAPDAWLIEQVGRLRPGRALELACGLGHNAIWLA